MSTTVCWINELLPERPASALVVGDDGSRVQVAVVRLHDDTVHAVGMWDPVARANVMARGLVGSTVVHGEEVPVIFSPMYKQAYDLRTGACLSDPDGPGLGSWRVEVVDGLVVVGERLDGRAALGESAWARAS
jgi:nitrite reductase (NADH) small subunit